jgi:hypothetical protein
MSGACRRTLPPEGHSSQNGCAANARTRGEKSSSII